MPPRDQPPTSVDQRPADAPLPDAPLPGSALPAASADDATLAPHRGAPRGACGWFLWILDGEWLRRFVDRSQQHMVSVPRRFGMGTLLILITCYALWFQLGRVFGLHPAMIAGVGVYFFVLGLVQWFVGEGRRVRWASAWTGVVISMAIQFPMSIVMLIGEWRRTRSLPELLMAVAITAVGLICTVPGSLFLGYAGGTLVAGVFLLMQMADEAVETWRNGNGPRGVEVRAAGDGAPRGGADQDAPRSE